MTQEHLLLEKARKNIGAAELLLGEALYDIAASRAYYGMFYIAEALLFSKGLSFSSHAAVISTFGKEFAKTNVIEPIHHRHLLDAFEARQIGDYAFDTAVSQEKTIDIINWANAFYDTAVKYLNP